MMSYHGDWRVYKINSSFVPALQGRSTVARYSRCPMQIWGCSPSAGRMCPAWSSMHLKWPDSDGFPPLQEVSTAPPCQVHTHRASSFTIS